MGGYPRPVTTYGNTESITSSSEMYVFDCPDCGVPYGLDSAFQKRRKADGRRWYCPNGHGISYSESELDIARKEAQVNERRRKSAELELDRTRADRDVAKRRLSATQGVVTRQKKRIANGVCPVAECRRSGFDDVANHIEQVHPGWTDADDDDKGGG